MESSTPSFMNPSCLQSSGCYLFALAPLPLGPLPAPHFLPERTMTVPQACLLSSTLSEGLSCSLGFKGCFFADAPKFMCSSHSVSFTHVLYLTPWKSCCAEFSCVQFCAAPWTAACQAPLSMGILQARILEWVAMPSSRLESLRDIICQKHNFPPFSFLLFLKLKSVFCLSLSILNLSPPPSLTVSALPISIQDTIIYSDI